MTITFYIIFSHDIVALLIKLRLFTFLQIFGVHEILQNAHCVLRAQDVNTFKFKILTSIGQLGKNTPDNLVKTPVFLAYCAMFSTVLSILSV